MIDGSRKGFSRSNRAEVSHAAIDGEPGFAFRRLKSRWLERSQRSSDEGIYIASQFVGISFDLTVDLCSSIANNM